MSATVTETVNTAVSRMDTVHMKLQAKTSHSLAPHPPMWAKPKGKLMLDPQRALEPARKKLTTLESQRIMAVLVETIKRIQLVSAFPFIIENLFRFSVTLGSDLVKLMEQHKVNIESFEELKLAADQLRKRQEEERERLMREEELRTIEEEEEGYAPASSRISSVNSLGIQVDEAMRNLLLVAKQMQFTCREILRGFAANPSAIRAILSEVNQQGNGTDELIGQMSEMKGILMNKLLTTPVEEAERKQYLCEISERERYNSGIIVKLEAELEGAQEDKDEEIRKKNDVIRRLQANLHQIEKFSDEHIHRTKTEAEKQELADYKNSEGKKQKLNQDLAQLRAQLQSAVAEHRESEQSLRKKKFQIETEVENWILKYDQDMGERQDEYEEIDAVYTEEKKQLNELEERFKTLEAEYNQIQEERRIAREKQEAAERQLQIGVKAATTIQAFWRSFKVRKALKSKKKKGKGKKGKK